MATYDPSMPPLVSETLLKKRRNLDELAHRRSITVEKQVKRKRVVRGEDIKIKRPEMFVTEFRIQEGSMNKMNRRKRKVEKKKTPVPKSNIKSTVGFVVRIHTGRHANQLIKGDLMRMGLLKKYDAKFVKLDAAGIGKHISNLRQTTSPSIYQYTNIPIYQYTNIPISEDDILTSPMLYALSLIQLR
jgi:hypothetical protein